MIINKQITIIITCPKPVVSSKLIYDELGLKFLGTWEWGEEEGFVLTSGHRMGLPRPSRDRTSSRARAPREAPSTAFSSRASQSSCPCLGQSSFLDTLLAFLIQFILLEFIQRIYAYEIII